jgi:carboxyl-terminal processing protease
MRSIVAALLLLAAAGAPPRDDFQADFDDAVAQVAKEYAYFDAKATRWYDVKTLYAADLKAVHDKREFIGLLERVVDELYDPHAQLTVNTAHSMRLVPSGADLWATWRDREAVITEVRAGSDAERAGVQPRMVVVTVNGVAIADAVDAQLGRSYPHSTAAARDWALRAVLAGRHNERRALRFRDGTTVVLPARDQTFTSGAAPLTFSELRGGVGLIRFNDSLGDVATIAAFDRALHALRNTRALIVDLRDTPSGGNTTVARGVLGRFVKRDAPYQKHVLPAEERETGIRRSWLELVSPRGPFAYERPVAVLVDHWTGSMGEGLAIGFDAVGRGTVIGTPMAALLGATHHVTLPRTGIGINIPAERLYHVDGTPRESFLPRVAVDVGATMGGDDPFILAALKTLND